MIILSAKRPAHRQTTSPTQGGGDPAAVGDYGDDVQSLCRDTRSLGDRAAVNHGQSGVANTLQFSSNTFSGVLLTVLAAPPQPLRSGTAAAGANRTAPS